MLVKHIKLDDENRIVVGVQDIFQTHLTDKENVKQLRSMVSGILGEDMFLFKSSSKTIRLTLTPGKEEETTEKLKIELANAHSMVMDFMKNNPQGE